MIPPGFIHSLGKGILVVEFQQNNDITERIYDFGRGRPLQTEEAIKRLNSIKFLKRATESQFRDFPAAAFSRYASTRAAGK